MDPFLHEYCRYNLNIIENVTSLFLHSKLLSREGVLGQRRREKNIDKFDIRILSWSLPWSVSHSLCPQFFYQTKGKTSLSVQCVAAEIKYSSQILQSCSKLR